MLAWSGLPHFTPALQNAYYYFTGVLFYGFRGLCGGHNVFGHWAVVAPPSISTENKIDGVSLNVFIGQHQYLTIFTVRGRQ